MTMHIEAHGERSIRVTRRFAAPRALVYRAHIEPELVKRWLGTTRMDWTRCEIDARPGGRFRYEWSRPGMVMGMGGTFIALDPPRRIVHTESFDEDWTDGEVTVTTTFHAEGPDRTRLEMVIDYASAATRDRVLAGPMKDGMAEGYDVLDEVLPLLG